MTQIPDDKSPVNPLPPVVIALVLILGVIELVLSGADHGILGGPEGIGWRTTAIETFGFFTSVFDWMIENSRFPIHHVWRFITYAFAQPDPMQTVFVAVFVLALGKYVAENLGQRAVLAIFFVAAVVPALIYGAISTSRVPLIGGYPPAFGLVGAFVYVLWMRLRASGQDGRVALVIFAFFTLVQVGYGLWFSPSIVWITQLLGLWIGTAMGWLLFPGRLGRILERVRSRG